MASKSTNFSWPTDGESVPHVCFLKSEESTRVFAPESFDKAQAFNFLLDCLSVAASAPCRRAFKLVLPGTQGYITRSDILSLRFADCRLAQSVVSFVQPKHHFDGKRIEEDIFESLIDIFLAAAGGILLSNDSPGEVLESALDSLHTELDNRLSFPWITAETQPRQTIALVEGGKGPASTEGIVAAAKALDIGIIVLDRPGHWLQGEQYEHWREAFIAIDRSPDEGLPQRITDALQKHGEDIDGITTFFEPLMPAVARVAERLSLPTAPPSAYEVASDKYRTGIAEGRPAYRVSSFEETKPITDDNELLYPLIVKPCSGWGSEGVFKVNTVEDLKVAFDAIDFKRHGSNAVIESYCGGPELDVNFVLCDGEVIFFEASDDFPSPADDKDAKTLTTFIEYANVLPSGLPPDEVEMVKTSLSQSLLRLGFRFGFFHLEARVQHSAMQYSAENGILDITTRENTTKSEPSAWLIEINSRPPGFQATNASIRTYGIDYYAIALLSPLGDLERMRALSHPFKGGPQYWCEIVFISVTHGGVFESSDVCMELKGRRPDLAGHISKSYCFFKKGDKVARPESGILAMVAYYLVFSRQSRLHLLEVAQEVRRETRFSIL